VSVSSGARGVGLRWRKALEGCPSSAALMHASLRAGCCILSGPMESTGWESAGTRSPLSHGLLEQLLPLPSGEPLAEVQ